MNERIRELAVESGFATGYDRTQTGKWSLSDRELEKFAELIVKECAEWIKNTDSDPDIGEEDAKALLEHFGVEE